ncbi:programmed cell death 1 ligand 1-like [Neosynchiropus ocellatus]
MAGVKILVTLVSLLWGAASSPQPDITVYSRYMSDQVLPGKFHGRVYWSRDGAVVHSYYDGQDQLAQQNPQFRGRTFLFKDQLSRGNASLLLKEVQVSDRGLYRCYTNNSRGDQISQESSVNLEVEAPVTKVSIVQEGDTITCRSEGIYPEPQVTWPRNMTTDTRIEQTEQQLYNIRSSVRVDGEGDYTCHVRTLRSNRSATLTPARSITLSGAEATLDCPALKSPPTSVTWRFNNSIIVQREGHLNVSERWRDHVKNLSMSGRLTLQTLSPDLSGIYTCEVTNEEETHVKIISVTVAEKENKPSSNSMVDPTPHHPGRSGCCWSDCSVVLEIETTFSYYHS